LVGHRRGRLLELELHQLVDGHLINDSTDTCVGRIVSGKVVAVEVFAE